MHPSARRSPAIDFPPHPPDIAVDTPTRRRDAARRPPRVHADDRDGSPRRSRQHVARRHDDDGIDDFFDGPRLLKSLDTALALPPTERNRAFVRIVLGVEGGAAQQRGDDCACMLPDLGVLITLMAGDGIDEATRQSGLELAEALQHLALHGDLADERRDDLEIFAERLRALPAAG